MDQLWEQASFYEFYAHEYGFLPDEVDGQRLVLMELFPAIRSLRRELRAEAERRAAENGSKG